MLKKKKKVKKYRFKARSMLESFFDMVILVAGIRVLAVRV